MGATSAPGLVNACTGAPLLHVCACACSHVFVRVRRHVGFGISCAAAHVRHAADGSPPHTCECECECFSCVGAHVGMCAPVCACACVCFHVRVCARLYACVCVCVRARACMSTKRRSGRRSGVRIARRANPRIVHPRGALPSPPPVFPRTAVRAVRESCCPCTRPRVDPSNRPSAPPSTSRLA